jgi:hypothetical protein
MLLLRKDKLNDWLRTINRKQKWLADEMGIRYRGKPYTAGFISQLMHNKCKIPSELIEQLLLFTNIPFDELFYINGSRDSREFFGKDIYNGADNYSNKRYQEMIDKKIKDGYTLATGGSYESF